MSAQTAGLSPMNNVNLIGNLTKDPELRDAGGTPVANLRLAVSGRRKQGEDWIDVPNFFNVTVWGRQAELAGEHLVKGQKVGVSGRLLWREWEAEDGSSRQAVEVVADSLDYLQKPQGYEPAGQADGVAPEPVTADGIPY